MRDGRLHRSTMSFNIQSSGSPVSHWLERDGVAISWREAGQGPALVLLHAFPLSAMMWNALVQHWKLAFRIIAPIARGFDGPSPLSSRPGHGYAGEEQFLPVLGAAQTEPSLRHYAEDVAAICTAGGIHSAIFTGCSMGGYVLLELLRRHPGLVRAAIFCDTRPEADTEESRAGRYDTNRWLEEAVEQSGAAAAGAALAERLLPRLLGATTRQQRPQIVQQVRTSIENAPVDAILCANAAMATRPDSRSLLPQIRVPALVIAGEEDAITPPRGATEFAGQIPGAALHIVPGAGHLLPLEAPVLFAQAVESWLRAHGLFPA